MRYTPEDQRILDDIQAECARQERAEMDAWNAKQAEGRRWERRLRVYQRLMNILCAIGLIATAYTVLNLYSVCGICMVLEAIVAGVTYQIEGL